MSEEKIDSYSIPKRRLLIFCGFFTTLSCYLMRVDLNLAIVAMVKPIHHTNLINQNFTCFNSTVSSNITEIGGHYEWDTSTQGLVLGAFYIGYTFGQIPGALASHYFSPKKVIIISHLIVSICHILIPILTPYSYTYLVIIRATQGLFQGFEYPTFQTLIANWIPPLERGRSIAAFFSGNHFGIITAQVLGGYICQPYMNFDTGEYASYWPIMFYSFGGYSLFVCILMFFIIYDSPHYHPTISTQEKISIIKSINKNKIISGAEIEIVDDELKLPDKEKTAIPYRKILTSLPFYSILVTHVCFNWTYYTLITCLPTYMSTVLGYSIKQNGLLSTLPYVFQWIASIIASSTGDIIIKKNILSVKNTRKIANSISLMGTAICIVCAGLLGCQTQAVVIMFCATTFFLGFSLAGYSVNFFDISGHYSSTLFSVSNTIASIPGLFGPLLVGYLTKEGSTIVEWLMVFYVSAGVAAFGTIFNCVFTSGRMQKWAT